jgi:hypothetical protein
MQRFIERFFSSGCGGLSIIPQIAFCTVQLLFCPFVLLDNIEQLRVKRLLADGMRAADKRRTSACPDGSSQQQSFISSAS